CRQLALDRVGLGRLDDHVDALVAGILERLRQELDQRVRRFLQDVVLAAHSSRHPCSGHGRLEESPPRCQCIAERFFCCPSDKPIRNTAAASHLRVIVRGGCDAPCDMSQPSHNGRQRARSMTENLLKLLDEQGAGRPLKPPVDEKTLTHKQFVRGPFWQKIPAYAGVSEEQFLDHEWQAQSSITNVHKLLAAAQRVATADLERGTAQR